MDNKNLKYHLIISIIAAILFIPFLGSVNLFDWDEINFAECAREMIVTGNYSQVQINFQPFWEKPPLFIWMQALSMKAFGVNEFAARFPNAICGIITLNVLFYIGRKLNDLKFAIIWVLVYASSLLTFFYFKTGIIDPWFNLFIFIGIYQAILFTNNTTGKKSNLHLIISGAFIGLSVLTKGPVGLLIFGLTAGIFILLKRFKNIGNLKHLLLFISSFALVGFGWFLIEILKGNGALVKEFIIYQIRLFNTKDSGHGGFLLYHFVILLIGCFPASLFFIPSHKTFNSDTPFQKHAKQWMMILFWVVLILFTIVKTKIVHYSSMCWFPLTYLAAYSINKLLSGELKFKKWHFIMGVSLITLLGLVFTLIPLIDIIKPYLLKWNLIGDKFAIENLKANGGWMNFEWLVGVIFITFGLFTLIKIKRSQTKYIYHLFFTSLLTIFLVSFLIVPPIERYSQGAAIDFYKSLKGVDCYLETSNFKSYAYLFYSDKQPKHNTPRLLKVAQELGEKDLKEGINDPMTSFARYTVYFMETQKLEKPGYMVLKFDFEEHYAKNFPEYKKLYAKNGFVFLRKEPEILK